ncbi:MBL fold metallo-hydrolase [Beggiatoa leptomitoformis]|uniref:MBL fold metallo-hydrolase n=1 Tax=Beggiatoa leptomitoformis TaxID=288004 RepID=A0A2N9YI70_9GAMM|nr:MBL fold metallo-hydrolase [Beggiatoa leptomitoformis]AUI70228.2 MBL fold metallo-hydrolase [Beggiatoa leptomitoformis]
MQYVIISVTPYLQNCTLLWCDKTKEGMVVDPGGDVARILSAVQKQGVTLKGILLTHGHLDHVGGSVELAKQLEIPIIGPHKADKFWLDALFEQSRAFGFPPHEPFLPQRWLIAGDTINFGEITLEVRHCPGHTPGHIVFFNAESRLVLVGDVLFKGSVGRTDFPQGNHKTLISSIKSQLWTLGDAVTFIPGHGENSTIGEERRTNPFVDEHLL